MWTAKRPHLSQMLEEQTGTLDRIFGVGGYTLESSGEYSAVLKTRHGDFEFTDDPRDFVAASVISVPGQDVVPTPIDGWMRYLDVETPGQTRSDTYDVQLAKELHWVSEIVGRILNDPERTRNAVWFLKGYNAAYNDWAGNKGSWTPSDFE